jgi:hypothetical protein
MTVLRKTISIHWILIECCHQVNQSQWRVMWAVRWNNVPTSSCTSSLCTDCQKMISVVVVNPGLGLRPYKASHPTKPAQLDSPASPTRHPSWSCCSNDVILSTANMKKEAMFLQSERFKHNPQYENPKDNPCRNNSLTRQYLMYHTAIVVLNQVPCHAAIQGAGRTGPHIHLGTRQTGVVVSLSQPFHPEYHMNMKLGGPQSQPGYCGDQRIFLPCQPLNHDTLIIQATAHCYNGWAISAPFKYICYP